MPTCKPRRRFLPRRERRGLRAAIMVKKKGKELMQQLSLFDSDDGQQPIAAKSIELFTIQQTNRYREMGAQLFCTCSDYPRAQISVVRYSQGAFQVKVAGIDGWITPHRVWAEVTNQALEQLKDSSL